MNTHLAVCGSVAAVAASTHRSVAEVLMDVERGILIDVSGSMDTKDSRDGRRRYDVAVQVLCEFQERYPGKLLIVAFSDYAEPCPAGVPSFIGAGTNLAGALDYLHDYDYDVLVPRWTIISDGIPDSETEALKSAARFRAPIDTVFVGPEHDSHARDFLTRLATVKRGVAVVDNRALELETKAALLLAPAGGPA